MSVRFKAARRAPDRCTPGEYLREEFIELLGLSAGKVARLRRAAHADQADRTENSAYRRHRRAALAKFFGTTPEFWMNLQGPLRGADRPARGGGRTGEDQEVRGKAA